MHVVDFVHLVSVLWLPFNCSVVCTLQFISTQRVKIGGSEELIKHGTRGGLVEESKVHKFGVWFQNMVSCFSLCLHNNFDDEVKVCM